MPGNAARPRSEAGKEQKCACMKPVDRQKDGAWPTSPMRIVALLSDTDMGLCPAILASLHGSDALAIQLSRAREAECPRKGAQPVCSIMTLPRSACSPSCHFPIHNWCAEYRAGAHPLRMLAGGEHSSLRIRWYLFQAASLQSSRKTPCHWGNQTP